MATTYSIAAYPKEIALRDGAVVRIRPLDRDDGAALLHFFLGIPEDERFFLKDDVTSPAVIKEWTGHLNYNRALPIVAVESGQIIGEAVLVRRRGNARSHVGDLRVTVAPAWRNKGLGTALIRELCDIANDADLDKVLFELVEGCQTGAAEAARAIGFVAAGRIDGGARDTDGHLHDVTILSMPLGKYYEWSKY
jgi:L-amino acid N-acyltransferase YncA